MKTESEIEAKRRTPGRRPLREGSADDTRADIRRHALQLFNERGYASVSIDDIAAAAGLTRASLYYHYRSKADIFIESVLVTVEWAHSRLHSVLQQPDLSVRERLTHIVRTRRELAPLRQAAHEIVNEAMVEEALPHLNPQQRAEVDAGFQRLRGVIRELMEEGIARGELRPVPSAILAFMFWQLIQPNAYAKCKEVSRELLEEQVLLCLFEGIGVPPQP